MIDALRPNLAIQNPARPAAGTEIQPSAAPQVEVRLGLRIRFVCRCGATVRWACMYLLSKSRENVGPPHRGGRKRSPYRPMQEHLTNTLEGLSPRPHNGLHET